MRTCRREMRILIDRIAGFIGGHIAGQFVGTGGNLIMLDKVMLNWGGALYLMEPHSEQ